MNHYLDTIEIKSLLEIGVYRPTPDFKVYMNRLAVTDRSIVPDVWHKYLDACVPVNLFPPLSEDEIATTTTRTVLDQLKNNNNQVKGISVKKYLSTTEIKEQIEMGVYRSTPDFEVYMNRLYVTCRSIVPAIWNSYLDSITLTGEYVPLSEDEVPAKYENFSQLMGILNRPLSNKQVKNALEKGMYRNTKSFTRYVYQLRDTDRSLVPAVWYDYLDALEYFDGHPALDKDEITFPTVSLNNLVKLLTEQDSTSNSEDADASTAKELPDSDKKDEKKDRIQLVKELEEDIWNALIGARDKDIKIVGIEKYVLFKEKLIATAWGNSIRTILNGEVLEDVPAYYGDVSTLGNEPYSLSGSTGNPFDEKYQRNFRHGLSNTGTLSSKTATIAKEVNGTYLNIHGNMSRVVPTTNFGLLGRSTRREDNDRSPMTKSETPAKLLTNKKLKKLFIRDNRGFMGLLAMKRPDVLKYARRLKASYPYNWGLPGYLLATKALKDKHVPNVDSYKEIERVRLVESLRSEIMELLKGNLTTPTLTRIGNNVLYMNSCIATIKGKNLEVRLHGKHLTTIRLPERLVELLLDPESGMVIRLRNIPEPTDGLDLARETKTKYGVASMEYRVYIDGKYLGTV